MTSATRIPLHLWPIPRPAPGQAGVATRPVALGRSDDPLESAAERAAEQALARPAGTPLARPDRRDTGGPARGREAVPTSVSRELGRAGQPIDDGLRQDMEHRFGSDFSQVRIHADADAAASARAIGALAYTSGFDIVFAANHFAPAAGDGRRLLAHELAHCVQQSAAPGSGQVQRQTPPGANAVDQQAQAIIDAAKDSKTTPDVGKRAVAAVWAILRTYYPAEVGKVSSVEYDEKELGLSTSPVGSGSNLTGKINVGRYFVEHIDSFARRTLQVGHELQHVDQQRGGMGGPANQNKREFLAFAWEALQDPKTGTGRLGYAMRRDMIDCALGHLYCLSADEQKGFEDKKQALLKKRGEVDGKGGNPPVAAPTACQPCSKGSSGGTGKSATPAPTGKVTTQPTPTQVSASEEDKPKIEGALSAGGETEISKEGAESTAKLSFEATFPVATLFSAGGLKTRPLLGGAPLKFFDEFSLEPSVGLRRGDATHPLLTPLAIEGSLKMASMEWEKLTRIGAFKFGTGLSAVVSGEYVPQTGEGKVEAGGELGGEAEYRVKKDSPFFVKVEAKGQIKFQKTGASVFQWEGASFSTGAKVGVSF